MTWRRDDDYDDDDVDRNLYEDGRNGDRLNIQ